MSNNSITVYGTAWCGDCRRAKRVLEKNGVGYTWVDIDSDPEGVAVVQRLNRGMRSVPTILFQDGTVLVEPSDAKLEAELKNLTKE